MELAGPPTGPEPLPPGVAAWVGDRTAEPVWRNQAGGLTFAVGDGADRCFVKWAPPHSGLDLAAEAERLRWVREYDVVPEVLGLGGDDAEPDGAWLALAALPGGNAVEGRWRQDPALAVRAIALGLRRLHDAAPVAACPFDWSAESRVGVARRRAADGLTRPEAFAPEHQDLAVDEALARIGEPPEVDRLVVCHGDACAPNTLLLDDGTWSGHVDLGALGVADRWADLAIATWSTAWNYGPGWEDVLLETYGVTPDPVRTAYYRLLWDLT